MIDLNIYDKSNLHHHQLSHSSKRNISKKCNFFNIYDEANIHQFG